MGSLKFNSLFRYPRLAFPFFPTPGAKPTPFVWLMDNGLSLKMRHLTIRLWGFDPKKERKTIWLWGTYNNKSVCVVSWSNHWVSPNPKAHMTLCKDSLLFVMPLFTLKTLSSLHLSCNPSQFVFVCVIVIAWFNLDRWSKFSHQQKAKPATKKNKEA